MRFQKGGVNPAHRFGSWLDTYRDWHLGMRAAGAEPAQSKPTIKTVTVRQLSFEPLPREGDGPARFAARGPGYSLFVSPAEADLTLPQPGSLAGGAAAKQNSRNDAGALIQMKLVGV